MPRKQRVLVTGATGFIGGFLLDALRTNPQYEVVVAGRRCPEVEDGAGVEFFCVGDIGPDTDWRESLEGADIVFHLAGLAHVNNPGVEAEEAFRRVNELGTHRLAKQAVEAGVRRFVFLSSIGVNGNANHRPFTVSDEPAPRELYATSKLDAENRLKAVCGEVSMSYTIVRPPLVYGPGAPGNFGLLNSIVRKGVPLPLYATGNLRSFVSVWNLVDLLLRCGESDRAANKVFLVCDGHDVSTSDFLRLIGRASGRRTLLFPLPPFVLRLAASAIGKRGIYDRLFDSLQVDDRYTRSELGWQAPLTLEESLERCF